MAPSGTNSPSTLSLFHNRTCKANRRLDPTTNFLHIALIRTYSYVRQDIHGRLRRVWVCFGPCMIVILKSFLCADRPSIGVSWRQDWLEIWRKRGDAWEKHTQKRTKAHILELYDLILAWAENVGLCGEM